MIEANLIEEIRTRADIVEIVAERVPLKKAGKEYRGLCPFHTEKTPSFYVVPAKGFFNCFGCQASGDVFSFLMRLDNISFIDAVRLIAARYGIEVPEHDATQVPEPFRVLYETLAFAADHFRRNLRDDALGAPARSYLEMRGVTPEVADRFELGYALDTWQGLRESAARHGIPDEVLLEAGLIKVGERVDEPYDRFRGRLIFPILDLAGRTIAFGGRHIGSGKNAPKYLNSPETPVYHKGSNLYGLNWARNAIRRDGTALVVEGQMDYLALAGRGAENVVAPQGTAMTIEQANLLARYASRAILLYDSDAAGLKATFRTADALLRAGVHPLVATLPAGEDPDSLIRSGGVAAFKALLDDSSDVMERKIQMLAERGFFNDIEGVRRALDRLLPTVRATIDPALRDIYISRVAERTGVRIETIEHEVAGAGRSPEAAPPPASRPRADAVPARPVRRPPEVGPSAERLLLVVLLRDPERGEAAAQEVPPESLSSETDRELYRALLGERAEGWEDALGPDAARRLEELRADPTIMTNADRNFMDAVAGIVGKRLHLQREDVLRRLKGATAQDERVALLAELADVLSETRAVQSRLQAKLNWKFNRPQPGTR
jgi:DNA primase